MIWSMLCLAIMWLIGLALAQAAAHRFAIKGDKAGTAAAGLRARRLGPLVGGGAGIGLWSSLLFWGSTTLIVDSGEFAWLPYMTIYPLTAALAGAAAGRAAVTMLRREMTWPGLGLRAAAVVALGWIAYGIVLAQVPAATELPAAVVLAHRGVAALGCAAVTTALVDLYCFPPREGTTAGQLLERLLMLCASLLTVVLAQVVVWDEVLARLLGLPVR